MPAYLGNQGIAEAASAIYVRPFVVDGPWAFVLAGDSYRVFDLR